jgi:hypothetical protein
MPTKRFMIRPPPQCIFIQHQTAWAVDMYLEFPAGQEDAIVKWFQDWTVQLEFQARQIKMVEAAQSKAATEVIEAIAKRKESMRPPELSHAIHDPEKKILPSDFPARLASSEHETEELKGNAQS